MKKLQKLAKKFQKLGLNCEIDEEIGKVIVKYLVKKEKDE